MYIYVGGNGASHAGWNGGGDENDSSASGGSGGGASDIRLTSGAWDNVSSLNSRIMVAGGGSGSARVGTTGCPSGARDAQCNYGAEAGGLIGYSGYYHYYNCDSHSYPVVSPAMGGSQTSGGSPISCSGGLCMHSYSNKKGMFGKGANGSEYLVGTSGGYVPGGAGGGYYGGGGGGTTNCNVTSSAGGSSYISGHTGSVAIAKDSTSEPRGVRISGCTTGTSNNSCSIHYSGKYFTETLMIDGAGYRWTTSKITNYYYAMPNPANAGSYPNGTGNMADGYARITLTSTS